MTGTPRKIAVALLGAIGDVVLSTPLLESLRRAYPGARISFVVGSTSAPVLAHLPLVDELIVLPEGPRASRLSDLRFLIRVAGARFDWSLCLTRAVKLATAFWAARVPVRLGYLPIATPWMFTHRLDALGFPASHRTDFFLAAAERLGVPRPPGVRLHYRVTEEEREEARRLLSGRGADPDSDTLIAIHPGTSRVMMERRRWAAENFAAVARTALATPGRRIVLLGGSEESGLSEVFQSCAPDSLLDLTDRLTLRQMAAVLRECRLLLHNDSSPLHLAGAVGVPVLAVFGYQNPVLWGPLSERDRVVRRELPCSPCLSEHPCDRSMECIRQLPPSMVSKVLEEMLARESVRREEA